MEVQSPLVSIRAGVFVRELGDIDAATRAEVVVVAEAMWKMNVGVHGDMGSGYMWSKEGRREKKTWRGQGGPTL